MMNDKMENLIKESLTPMHEPDDILNQAILCSAKRKGRNNMMKMKKLPFVAAIAVCALCVASGTVYAAVHFLRDTTAFQHGITANVDISESQDTMFESMNVGDIKDSESKILSEENGDSETPWLSKEVQQVTEYLKVSDDSVNWTDSRYIVDKTIYSFADYATAAKVAEMDNWFTSEYELVENVDYVESVSEDAMHVREITAMFKCGEGYFELAESKDLLLAEDDSNGYVLITNEVTDSKKYLSAQGHEFTIVDDVVDGVKRSNVAISYKNYTGSLSFYHMTDEAVERVLDEIQIK